MHKEQKSARLLWVDWLILAVAAMLAVLALLGWKQSRQNAAQTLPITYTLCLSGVDIAYLDGGIDALIPIGCRVMNANGTAEMGAVVAVWSRPTTEPVALEGAVAFVARTDRVDLLVRVRATASETHGDGFRVQDIRISAGKSGDFRIGGYYAPMSLIVRVEWEGI